MPYEESEPDDLQTQLGQQLAQAVFDGDFSAVIQLLELGADSEFSCHDSTLSKLYGPQPVLISAARRGYVNIGKALIEYGADPNIVEMSIKDTPIIAASEKGHAEFVKMLLNHNVPINTGDEVSPFTSAVHGNHFDIVKLLVEHDPSIINNTIPRLDNSTALHLAAENGFYRIIEYLIDHGANVNATDDLGKTPLHYFLEDHTGNQQFTTDERGILDYFIMSGADLTAEDNDGIRVSELIEEATEPSLIDSLDDTLSYHKSLVISGVDENLECSEII